MTLHLPQGDYVGVNEAAAIAGVSYRTIRRMIADREMRAYQVQERVWLIRLEEALRVKNSPATRGRPRGT